MKNFLNGFVLCIWLICAWSLPFIAFLQVVTVLSVFGVIYFIELYRKWKNCKEIVNYLTKWKCEACGRRREDDRISVYIEKQDSSERMVNYCNDNPKCEFEAAKIAKKYFF